ncbi:MAG: CapA family protein, partial [Oscillospiraceae bacterium]|nr:CapA family protein [Oscillospiraceae bacterium]
MLLAATVALRVLVPDLFGSGASPAVQATAVPTEAAVPAAAATPEATPEPTPEPTPTPTPEPTPQIFTISAIGDCTLITHNKIPGGENNPASYTSVMNGDYSYPFANTVQYFANDDLTIANLECTLSDAQLYSDTLFHFRAPTSFANILTEGKVDFVNTANNHTADYGQQGIDDTCAALDAIGIPYCKEGESRLLTTESGLTVGIYCDYSGYYPKQEKCVEAIQQLRNDGAEYVICMFHWGQEEGVYKPFQYQIDLAHACIDDGADLIYGSHSHTLQPLEEYNGAYILYSMGNWTFGG